MKVKQQHKGQVYFGLNPIDRKTTIKKKLGDFSEEELAAWVQLNPDTSLKYIEGDVSKVLVQPNQSESKPVPNRAKKGDTDK